MLRQVSVLQPTVLVLIALGLNAAVFVSLGPFKPMTPNWHISSCITFERMLPE